MLQFDMLPQYTRMVGKLRFPQNRDNPYLMVYFSENSSLVEDYPKLQIRPIDAKIVVVPTTRVPRTYLTGNLSKVFKSYKLRAFSTKMRYPTNQNLIYDLSVYLNSIDSVYHPTTYRQRAGFLILDSIFKTFASFPANFQKILVYSVDLTKDLNEFGNRKIFPLLRKMKKEEFEFDHLLLTLVGESSSRYRLLVKDGEHTFARTLQYIRNIKAFTAEEETDEEVEDATNMVMKSVPVDSDVSAKVKDSVSKYLNRDKASRDKIVTGKATSDDMKRVTTGAVLYNVSGNLARSKAIANRIPSKSLNKAVKVVPKQYKDELLPRGKSENLSDYVLSQASNIPKAIDNKSPEHIFNKRKIDFETNLRKDMTNAFKVLENKDIPLKFDSISITEAPQKAGEIKKSDEAYVIVTLIDKWGKKHRVRIRIPRIDPNTGTFRINGKKKCMINQIVLNPISFPEPYDSKFESSYSAFHIYSKQLRKNKYLEAYMGSFKLPLLILLAYSFGFDETLKKYGVKYKIVDKKPGKDEVFSLIPSSYIVFEGLDTELKKQLAQSFIQAKVSQYKSEKEFGTKEYFNDVIINMTGRIDSTYHINNNLENIVDPIVRQVLVNEQLPSDLPNIIYYMTEKVVDGYVQERNDITHQRIRNSEILVHLAQKELLKAYTQYRQQVLAGNEKSKFEMPETKVISQFVQLEIVQNMEYANPAEEMATITKISPVGKSVGGIPDKMAVNLDARNVHPSYFGNIDTMDTAESDNIGITQQLTVDAFISSARGMFAAKPIKNEENSGILSTSTCLFPYVSSSDGNRVMMAANQIKQMLPLKNPEPPAVGTGYESVLTNVLSDSFVKRAPCTGKISEITRDHIVMICKGKKTKVDLSPAHLKSGSGKDTLSVFNPTVTVNQSVKEGDIIAEGGCMSGGTISLGRNLAACYMPYKGYNYEDGLVISDSLVKNDKLTSLHGIEEEMTVEANDKVLVIAPLGKKAEKGEIIFSKAMGELDELLGGLEDDEDELRDVYDGKKILKSPGGTVVDIEVFSNLPPEDHPLLKDLAERTNKKYKKPANEKWVERNVPIKGALIKFKIEQELPIGQGDKLCNRHGNKGIISLVEKEENMPITPWGERVEIILNPLGVIGRMNLGQILELATGFIAKEMANRMIKAKSKAEIVALYKKVFPLLDATKDKKFSKELISNISKLSNAQFNKMVQQIKTTGFTPVIVPPFQSPTRKNIMDALKVLGLKPGYKLKLPEFNTKTINEVPFGYLYISKLEHIGDMKIHARSTGPMTGKTMQPTGGKARGGGQKIGEGDTWALLSYNCPVLLSELFGSMSDDLMSKKEIEADIIQNGASDFKKAKVSPTKDLLNAYFTSLMLGE